MKLLEMDDKLMNRSVNEGFSGGEKKRNEILQLSMLEPKLAILDETDSGLDIDALRIVAQGVNAMRSPDRSFLVITHYQRLLDYIKPDFVHVLVDGKSSDRADRNWRSSLKRRATSVRKPTSNRRCPHRANEAAEKRCFERARL